MRDKAVKKTIISILTMLLLVMVLGTFSIPVSAAAKKNSGVTYYTTLLNHKKGGKVKNVKDYWLPGSTKVTYKGNTITFYGSFTKSTKIPSKFSKKNFVKYGKKTFKVTSKTQYFSKDIWKKYPMSKKRAFDCCKRLNGLSATLKVKNGKVEYMRFSS